MSKDTLIGFLMVISCSLISPLTNWLPAKDTYVKLAWRIQGWAAISLWFSLIMYLRYPATYISIRKDFYLKNILSTAFLAIFFLTWSAGYIIGSSFIVTSHAVIINSSSWFWISIVTWLVFKKINVLEMYGLLFYLAGFSIILSDSSAADLQRNTNQYKGYLYTFLGAGSLAIFSYLNYIIKLEIYPIIKLLQLYIFSFIFLMICSPFLSWSENFISFDPEYGVFGWIHNWNTIMIVFINSLITGIISIICFLDYSGNYSIRVVSCVMLLEPFIAQISGIILGKDEFFGVCTILGLGIVSVSLFVIGNGYVDSHKNTN